MTIKSFKRYEIKYFVTYEQFCTIKTELEKHMVLDKNCMTNGSYMIYNLYFDTDNNDIIQRSLDKPYYKEKLRLRSYSIPTNENEKVFLELKKKIGGIVAKRRAVIPYNQALEFVETGIIPEIKNYEDRQVLCEIKDFLERYNAHPKVFISYERVAYFDKNDSEFRVSFDKNILTRRTNVNLLDGDFGTELIDDGLYLMEVKCEGQLPMWLCHLLSEMKIYRTSFSKYGTEYKNYIAANRTKTNYKKNHKNYIKVLTAVNAAG